MDKPEFAWGEVELRIFKGCIKGYWELEPNLLARATGQMPKWRMTYNEAGDVIRLERVGE